MRVCVSGLLPTSRSVNHCWMTAARIPFAALTLPWASSLRVVACLLLLVAYAGPAPALVNNPPDLVGPSAGIDRWAIGTYQYRALSDDRLTGRERFYLTVAPDGTRTMRAFSDIFSRGVQTNVVMRVAPSFRPLDAYAGISTNGVLKGSGFFAVTDKSVDALVIGPNGKKTVSHVAVPTEFSLGTHPVALDGWAAWYLPTTAGARRKGLIYLLNGDARNDRPMLGDLTAVDLVFVGREEVTVPAGTFSADRFRLSDDSDLWVTGPDRLLVKYVWRRFDRQYLLTTLDRGENPAGSKKGKP